MDHEPLADPIILAVTLPLPVMFLEASVVDQTSVGEETAAVTAVGEAEAAPEIPAEDVEGSNDTARGRQQVTCVLNIDSCCLNIGG